MMEYIYLTRMNKQILIKIEFFNFHNIFCFFPSFTQQSVSTSSLCHVLVSISFIYAECFRYFVCQDAGCADRGGVGENTLLCLTTHKFQFNILWKPKKFINFSPELLSHKSSWMWITLNLTHYPEYDHRITEYIKS